MKKIVILNSITLIYGVFCFAQAVQKPAVVSHPQHLAIDSKDNLYVTMKYGIARISPDGTITDLRKLEGGGAIDKSFSMGGLVIDSKDNLFAAEGASIYKIKIVGNKIQLIKYAGNALNGKYGVEDGPLLTAKIQNIGVIAIDKKDNIYITQSYDWIKDKLKDKNYVLDKFIEKVPCNKVAYFYSFVRKISPDGIVSTIKTADGKYFLGNGIAGMAIDNEGNIFYTSSEGRSVEKINITAGTISHVAGKSYKRQYCPVYVTGDTSKAELFAPGAMIMDKSGALIYSDQRSHRVTKIANGKVITLAGNNIIDPCSQNIGGRAQEGHKDGKALTALFNFPKGLAYDSKGNLFIADQHNMCIRKLSPDGIVSSLTTFDRPQAMIETY